MRMPTGTFVAALTLLSTPSLANSDGATENVLRFGGPDAVFTTPGVSYSL